MNSKEFHFCSCGKLAYIQRLNEAGIIEYLCLQHIDEKVRQAIYGEAIIPIYADARNIN